MAPRRARTSDDDLVDRFERASIELRRKLEQLGAALERFDDAAAYERAWASPDPSQRNLAEQVHATFERSHQLLMDLAVIAVKLGERRKSLPPSNARMTERLVRARVIGAVEAGLVEDHRELRNQSQHWYMEQVPAEVWSAASTQLKRAAGIAGKLACWVAKNA